MKTYLQHIKEGINTTWMGMKLTLKHLWAARMRRSQNNIQEGDYFNQQNGMVTLQYPLETMPIPDNGRYRLHNEMDDCIVCDKCAKVCPVDCIDIEPIKATGEVGKASDGSPIRLYAAKFDIDMAKCCYCGLCTMVCPTECLTMTKTFDYSEFDVGNMNYHYATLSPAEAEEKKAMYEQFIKEKEELKRQAAVGSGPLANLEVMEGDEPLKKGIASKPVFKPTKPKLPAPIAESEPQSEEITQKGSTDTDESKPRPKPVFRPTAKPSTDIGLSKVSDESSAHPPAGSKPTDGETMTDGSGPVSNRPKPVFKPTMRPKKED